MNPLYPSVDQKAVWEMGYYLVHPVGDIPSIYVPNYWLKFPYQKNLAVFLSVFIRVTGCDKDDYRYFQYLNVISILFLLLGITLLGSLRHPDPQNGKKSGSFSDGLLSAVMFLAYSAPLILYTSYVYPTLISLTATVYSFILLLVCINGKERLPAGWYGVILCGGTICMAFAIFVYSGSVIAAIALAIVAIGDGVKGIWHALVRYRHSFAIQKEKKNAASLLMKSLLEILSILLIFVLFRFGQNISDDLFLKKCNIDKSEGIPAITTVPMGISSDSEDCVAGPGSYDGSKEFVYKHFNYDTYQTSKYSLSETKKIVGEYLSGKRSLTFFIRKTVYQWCDPWFSGISMANEGTLLDSNDESIQKLAAFEGFLSGSLNRHIHEFLTALLTAYYMAAFISGIVSFKKPDATTELLVIYFIGGFVFQLFWESKARYCLPYFILSIPIAASGIMKLVSYKRNAGD